MKKTFNPENCDPSQICFGLDRESDEDSLAAFLHMFSTPSLLNVLIPRMSDDDIHMTVDFLTGLMKRHLQEDEYHRLFLNEEKS
ncbi:MAG: hypothetical protein KQH63_12635 [Desulfobulbaceae bacterium]|nr:hypothetical protein [Desulfobulbaceae bacterium]